MGQIIHSIISLVLLLIFVSFGKSLEDHQYSFEFDEINIADIVEAVETVETITKEMEIIAEILPQSDMIETCRIILKSSGIIGDLIGIGFDFYFPEKVCLSLIKEKNFD
uniref:Uncharacterized protein n=1 Tax=Panagrolaimus superbus TaxID=310955 RepID=A0A914YD00_9BILA